MRKPLLDDPINVPAVVAGSTVATTTSGSATSPIAEALPAALVGKIFIHIMPVLMLGYGLSFIDRSNLAYAGLDEHLESDVPGLVPGGTAYGLAAGLFFLGYGTMQIPVVHAGSILPVLEDCDVVAVEKDGQECFVNPDALESWPEGDFGACAGQGYVRRVQVLDYDITWVELIEMDGVAPYTYSEELPYDELLKQHTAGVLERSEGQVVV